MGITLTSKTVSSTYDSLLKLSDNDQLTGAFKLITDGLGNDSGISINNSGDVNISGTLVVGERVNTPILQLTGGTGTQGTMSWNADEETVDLIQNGSTLQLGQEVQIHCKNQTGATIPDGTPVYVTGTLGASGRLTIAPMIADGSIQAKYFIGVTTEAIANGEDGKVTTFGKVRGLNTAAYSEGQTLWVSATTAGAFVTTRPVAPNLDLEVAIIINSHVNNGTLFVRSSIGHYLGTAHDVNISSVSENDLLVYKTNRWVNSKYIGDLSAANVTLSGYLRGPATFVIDPAAYGDETGLVQILGDLRVDGTTTTINSTTISVSDKNITLAKDAVTAGDANGAGITIAGANATLTYLSATDDFIFNKNVNASRFVGPLTGDVTGNADTASALETARNIALDGSVTGNADFDGSGNITITTTTNHNHDDIYYTETEIGNFFSGTTAITGYNKTNWDDAYNWGDHADAGYLTSVPVPVNGDWWNEGYVRVGLDGVMEMGKYMDFHTSDSGGNADFDLRVTVSPGVFSVGGQVNATEGNSSQWNTAYNYSQIGHLPLAGGELIGANNNLVIDEIDENTWAIQDTFQYNGIIIHSESGGLEFQYQGVTEMTIDGSGVSFTGTIDLSNADLNIGAADIIFGTASTGATRGIVWSVDGLFLSKIVSGGTDSGKVTIYTNIGTTTVGNTFEIYGANGLGLSLSNSGVLIAGGGSTTQWNTAYSWGDHAGAGYQPAATAITTSNIGSQSVNYAADAGKLYGEDNRIISPSELTAGRMKFGFTSWNNDNSSPYADFIHLRSYTDSSGGNDNLVTFLKSGIGMRIWQQSWGSASAYSSYVDVITSGNIGSQSVNYAASSGNAGTLDSIDSSQFLRSDESDTMTGSLTIDAAGVGLNVSSGFNTGFVVDGGTNSGVIADFKFGTRKAYINTSGVIYASSLFDIDDTNYYIDPASTSQTNDFRAAAYRGNANVGGTGTATWHPDGIYCGGTMWQYGTMYKNNTSIYDVSEIKLYNGPYIQYLNTKSLIIRAQDGSEVGITGRRSDGGFGFQIYGGASDYGFLGYEWGDWDIRKTPNGRMYLNNNNSYYLQTDSDNYVYRMMAAADMRAPGFYDIDNTDYYLDPTYVTSIRTVGSWRADSSAWDGEFAGKIQYHADNWYLQAANLWHFRTPGGSNVFSVDQGGNTTTSGYIYLNNNYGQSIVGVYTSTRYQGVFAMGDSYKLPIDGTSTGNLYGLAWSHPNAGGVASNLNTHGLLVMENGTFLAAVSGSIIARDDMRAPLFYDSNNTGFYVNPASSSILDGLRLKGVANNASGNDYILWIDKQNNYDWGIAVTGNLEYNYKWEGAASHTHGITGYAAGSEYFRVGTDYAYHNGSFRAPVFYDTNDTEYYLDPNTTGTSFRGRGEIFLGANSSGRYLRLGGNGGAIDEATVSASNGNLHIDSRNGYGLYLNHYSSGDILMNNGGGYALSYTSLRAPIFYDYNDTSFYLDPNGTSELSQITSGTRARWGEPIRWTNRQAYNSSTDYWTGTNGWGTAEGTWDTAWKGGFSGWDIWGSDTGHPQGSGYVHAQGIVSGQHATTDGGTGYGWMMVGAGDATPNRYWLRGKWYTTTSAWVEMYHTGNMDAPNKSGTSYYQTNTWMQFNGDYGLYWPFNYGAHFRPNGNWSYCQFRLDGSKNGYGGIVDAYSAVNGMMYDSAGNGGIYREAQGRWYLYHHVGNNCTSINTSTGSSAYGMYVDKAIYSTGDIIAYSDRRKKTDIVTIENALDKVKEMRGVFYTKIGEEEKGRKVGVIAQEMNEVLPEVVTYAEDVDEYGVAYGNIVGVLIEAIKEQQKQIDELKKLINK